MKTLKEWAKAHGVKFVGRSAGMYTTGTVSVGALEELFAEADALRRERDTACATLTRAGWEYIPDAICGPVWKPPVNAAMAKMRRERDEARGERDELVELLAEIEQSRPVEVDDDKLRDMAAGACQEALMYGVSEDVFLRLARSVAKLCARPAPAAAPEQASGCGACGDACRSRGSCRLRDESPPPCRTCGPDGCPDRVSCPKGGAA